ncbi:MAG: FKBP-type peptidyl-prolyl cis-trans isomerase [Apibacter sp.]|jgi:FKBP-type peptidyl-prolyl cis-trans isomerase FklB|uniref:Peptidyl-prolyl cis-trans isomerase n=1 Tax=Apibacter mensalis TaxID=1586267 RepID=A0A0X3AQG3_9FLAO|nr:FKBP-type peptidyl-prolyl cis-trans isomerase [Apibacter mensalis]MCO6565549.1 FKBP-type peptidyl-prolyl cis-trans isomerase [Apibacter sp.]CVK16604.1 FKBP-type peptidyl-prolyl cis-trans isomerase FklB [Apibacter mensalis]
MKRNKIIAVLCVACSLSLSAQNKIELKTDKEKLSYSLALNIAQNLKQQDMLKDVDVNIFNQALRDEIAGKPAVFPIDSINSFMQKYFSKKRQEFEKKRKEKGEINKTQGLAFLEKNKKKKGVFTTASGLQYEVLEKSKSTEKPNPDDMVKVKYTGKLLDGKIFDSTDKNNSGNPIEFQLNRVIKGWTEGVALMNKGSKYRFFIPSDLAYGENGAGMDIGPNSVLIFDIELVDFTNKNETKTE